MLLERGDDNVALFSSWVSIQPGMREAFFREERNPGEASPYVESTKSPFLIPAHSQVFRTIVFQPYKTMPLLNDGKKLEYEVVLRTPTQLWRSSNVVTWLEGTRENVKTKGAVLTEVEAGRAWKNEIAASNGLQLVPGNTLGKF